uniref:ATP-grasp domain-containing protein n=1 Tax=Arcella intermedia TaxID=1963864 RepID=A0A6B2L7J1_9EUKA
MPTGHKKTYMRTQDAQPTTQSPTKGKVLLVISADGNDWKEQFKGETLQDGSPLTVYNTSWAQLHVEASTDYERSIVCKLIEDGSEVEVSPHFVLFRAFPNDLFGNSYRRQVLGLAFSRIGGVNTVESVLRGMDRPVVHAEMVKIAEKLGQAKFPVISAKYHPNCYSGNKKRLIQLPFPTVIKVGSSYGGYGKMVAKSKGDYDDATSVLALGTEFFTEEPMIQHDYEFRVQVIGPYVRCFRRNSHNNWKNQCGNVFFEDHPWHPKYAVWVYEVRQMFGGLEMFGIDVLHRNPTPDQPEGEDFILEINDYAMGFDADYEPEDRKWVKDVVLQRMNELFCGAEKKSYEGQFIFSTYKRGDLKKTGILH